MLFGGIRPGPELGREALSAQTICNLPYSNLLIQFSDLSNIVLYDLLANHCDGGRTCHLSHRPALGCHTFLHEFPPSLHYLPTSCGFAA